MSSTEDTRPSPNATMACGPARSEAAPKHVSPRVVHTLACEVFGPPAGPAHGYMLFYFMSPLSLAVRGTWAGPPPYEGEQEDG